MSTASSTEIEVHYPESDGKPLGETGFHVAAIMAIHNAFKIAFRGRRDIYIASDMFLYYQQGNPRAVKAPDVMVIRGVDNHERRTWKLWVERVVPSAIFEVTSDETQREDATTKPEAYARIGVPEYFMFDPLGDYLEPQLQGYRLDGDRYARIVPDAHGGLPSVELGLSFRTDGMLVRVHDDRTGEPILGVVEQFEYAEAMNRRLVAQQRRADRNRKRAEREKANVEREKANVEREKANVEREKARADALEAEILRLRARLGDNGAGPG